MSTATVSCRQKPNDLDMATWLTQYTKYAPLEVTGIYGFFEEPSPLYGGRIYTGPEITREDVEFCEKYGLQLKINLTANKATEEQYEQSRKLLNTYYYPGNVVSMVDDNLARWVRRDYPNYKIEASVIKKTKFSTIEETLELYDQLVLPMFMNDDVENLKKIKQKDKIILFANAGCAYNCKHQICYSSVSKINKGEIPIEEYKCSAELKPRTIEPLHEFDLDKLRALGFNNFKFLTLAKGRAF